MTDFDRVVPYEDEQLAAHRRFQHWSRRYAPEYEKFNRFLALYPQLGSGHDFGRKLADIVRSVPATTLDRSTWYRAVVDKSDFDGDLFFSAAGSKPSRYGREGQTAFYVADSAKTAAVEALRQRKMESGVPVWIATVSFRRDLKVLDLSVPFFAATRTGYPVPLYGLIAGGNLREIGRTAEQDYVAYRVTQFVADLARTRGLDGIRYTSSREHPYRPDMWGTCLAVFKPNLRELVEPPKRQLLRWESCVESLGLPEMDLMEASSYPAIRTRFQFECARKYGDGGS